MTWIRNTIAIIFDFDDTLAPDSTTSFVASLGLDPRRDFWDGRVQRRLEAGWDPLLAQLHALVEISRERPAADRITRDRLAAFGRDLAVFDGVDAAFDRMHEVVARSSADVDLELYLVTCGIGEIIRHTSIASRFERIWASELHYDADGAIEFPRVLVSHTEKTRYLHKIAAGHLDETERPGVRDHDAQARVPFDQMIYVGDGFTDVPCLAMLAEHSGIGLGVYKEESKRRWGAWFDSAEDATFANLAPADYREGSELTESLRLALASVCAEIALRAKLRGDLDGERDDDGNDDGRDADHA